MNAAPTLILSVITPSALVLAEMPARYVHRKMLPHLTTMLRTHGLRQKDASYLEHLSGPDCNPRDAARIDGAFAAAVAGDPKRLPLFHLYRYDPASGFKLLRAPVTQP